MKDFNIEQELYEKGYNLGYDKGYRDGHLKGEEESYKFYYCESNGKYYVGKRLDRLYYAEIMSYPNGTVCLDYQMSRFLPWREHFKGYMYSSEPKEIPFEKWMEWFIKQPVILRNELRKLVKE